MKYNSTYDILVDIRKSIDNTVQGVYNSSYDILLDIREILKNGGGEEDTLNYLYFYANQDSTVEWTTDGSISPNLEYSTDGENFTEWDYSTISVPANSTIYFRGQNMDMQNISDDNNHFNIVGDMSVGQLVV